MFTGIVRELGTIARVAGGEDGVRLELDAPETAAAAAVGDSVALAGVCLTVVAVGGGRLAFDAVPETLDRTARGRLAAGDRINVEPALRAGEPLGGHVLQGHVDGVGRILERTPGEHWEVVRIALPAELARYVVEKGSIAVDGVSLTVSALSPAAEPAPWFEVSLIPTTLRDTTLGGRAPGDPVNLEVDVIAKYVERLLGARR